MIDKQALKGISSAMLAELRELITAELDSRLDTRLRNGMHVLFRARDGEELRLKVERINIQTVSGIIIDKNGDPTSDVRRRGTWKVSQRLIRPIFDSVHSMRPPPMKIPATATGGPDW